MADKKRVRVEYTYRKVGEQAKTTSLIFATEYDVSEKGWEEEVRKDFWLLSVWDRATTEMIAIKDIATV